MQKQFSELLLKAASDYEALTASVADFQWSQNFREPPSIWGVSSPHSKDLSFPVASSSLFIWVTNTLLEHGVQELPAQQLLKRNKTHEANRFIVQMVVRFAYFAKPMYVWIPIANLSMFMKHVFWIYSSIRWPYTSSKIGQFTCQRRHTCNPSLDCWLAFLRSIIVVSWIT